MSEAGRPTGFTEEVALQQVSGMEKNLHVAKERVVSDV